MRLLSWIFQPVYLIFFVIIAALYIYRAEVIPEHHDIEQSKTLVARMEQTVAAIEEEDHSVRSLLSNDTVITEESGFEQPTKLEDEANQQRLEMAAPSAIDALPLVAVDDTGADAEVISEDVDAEVTSEDADSTAIEKPSESLAMAGETESTEAVALVDPVNQPLPKSLGTLWYAARRAARSGNREEAVERYLQLTSNYPDSADGFGELGNIYYAMGDKERALAAYQQALNIYQAAGDLGQSLQLQKVISEIQ